MRKLIFIHKTTGSGDGGCPAAYAVEDSDTEYVLQGWITDDPAVVRTPADVIDLLPDGGRSIVHAVTRLGDDSLITGSTLANGELVQLRDLASNETAIAVTRR